MIVDRKAVHQTLKCLLFLGCLLDLVACQQEVPTPPPETPPAPSPAKPKERKAEKGELASISLVEFEKSGKFSELKVVEASVDKDPAFKKAKRYRGYRLDDVLAMLPGYKDLDWSTHELRMIASDGYTIPVPRSKLTADKGVLAFEDLSPPKGKKWHSFQQGKKTLTPAPFYLVWDGIPYGATHPWPYQLERISIVNLNEAYGDAYPKHAPDAAEGFAIYKARCITCHSVNLVVGKLGPEMNVPRNITTYRQREHLEGFIRNASAYRARTVMPAFGDLSQEEIDKVLHYLGVMKEARVCTTASECSSL